MSYTKRDLLPNEVVRYKATLHWIIFVPTVLWLALGFVFEAAGVAWIPVIIVFCSFVRALLRRLGSEFMLTNKRVVLRQGIISRKTIEVLLAKCESVSVKASSGESLASGRLWLLLAGRRLILIL